MNKQTIRPIAYIESDYDEKFGVPRQSGIVTELKQRILFCDEFRNDDAVRGLEGFSHIWLIWGFSENLKGRDEDEARWSPTVRPPRLGGDVRMGVFATRSPYRPNPLGLSSVKLEAIEKGPILIVSGADIVNGTPIYDIKPYIAYTDCHLDAEAGFTKDEGYFGKLEVVFPEELLRRIEEGKKEGLIQVLSEDPRGMYERNPGYEYGMAFAGVDIKFVVEGKRLIVIDVKE